MLMPVNDLIRALGVLARRADAGLAVGAARNAAVSVAERSARRLEDARTLRDLGRIGLTEDLNEPDAGSAVSR